MARLRTTTATSAGGIVVSVAGGQPSLVVGLRRREGVRRRGTWTLPKGTPDGSETIEQTAVREVEEETGLQVRLVAPLPSISYVFVQNGRRIDKTVHYWLMEPVGGDLARHDQEFERVRWVPFAEAGGLLSFDTERGLVAAAEAVLAARAVLGEATDPPSTSDPRPPAAVQLQPESSSRCFVVVANAGNAAAVSDALADRLSGWNAVLDDRSMVTSLVAIQGPAARAVLQPLASVDLAGLRYYAVAEGTVAGIPAMVARTGYTGEDGFEVFVDWGRAVDVWTALADAGRDAGVIACGLGARDTLRLEAGMPLYGNELGRGMNPFEAGLGRVVKLDKPGPFVGRDALARAAERGATRRLVGLVITGRGIARHGHAVVRDGRTTGVVTSGTHSPTLGRAIAMAYVHPDDGEPGTILAVMVRDQPIGAEVVPLPFYRRPR